MEELTKPTIDELVTALQILTNPDRVVVKDYDRSSASAILDANEKYLSKAGFDKLDKQNLLNVMDQISANGIEHFNMTSFFGTIDKHDREEAMIDYGYQDVSKISPGMFKVANLLDEGTKSFNCDSVGCIAGFASAIALNWNDTKVAGMDQKINAYRGWEHLACNYLNIPLAIGELIFFGENGCVWSYLKVNSNYFDHLEFTEETQCAIDCDDVSEDEWTELSTDLSSINYKTAVSALSMIVEDELTFKRKNGLWYPNLTDKYYNKL